nr:hypothetical protein [uncultured Clostridium sp.]
MFSEFCISSIFCNAMESESELSEIKNLRSDAISIDSKVSAKIKSEITAIIDIKKIVVVNNDATQPFILSFFDKNLVGLFSIKANNIASTKGRVKFKVPKKSKKPSVYAIKKIASLSIFFRNEYIYLSNIKFYF